MIVGIFTSARGKPTEACGNILSETVTILNKAILDWLGKNNPPVGNP